jgi:hypothetical protein
MPGHAGDRPPRSVDVPRSADETPAVNPVSRGRRWLALVTLVGVPGSAAGQDPSAVPGQAPPESVVPAAPSEPAVPAAPPAATAGRPSAPAGGPPSAQGSPQPPGTGATPKRLGRPFPAGALPRAAPAQDPDVSVSVVPAQPDGVGSHADEGMGEDTHELEDHGVDPDSEPPSE